VLLFLEKVEEALSDFCCGHHMQWGNKPVNYAFLSSRVNRKF
jgi:hypothetical protein